MAVNIYTTGGAGDGKTTLSAAIMYCLGSAYPTLNDGTVSGADPSGIARESYATPAHQFSHTDAPAAACDRMLSSSPKMDVALLVIAADNGPQQGTLDAIARAKAAGVTNVVAFLSKTDLIDDSELFELVEMEIRELLSSRGFKGDDVAVVTGSAKDALASTGARGDKKAAPIFALTDALDASLPAGIT